MFSSQFASLRPLAAMHTRARMPNPVAGLPRTQAALAYAQRMHAEQRREVDGAPFTVHPIEVASVLYYAGAADEVIAAGALHDTIEKAGADPAELRQGFGDRTAMLVLALTEDDDLHDYGQRKAALRGQVAAAGEEALMVFAADKISKLRELQIDPQASGTILAREPGKIAHYHESLRMLERLLPGSPLVDQLRDEFEALHGPSAAAA